MLRKPPLLQYGNWFSLRSTGLSIADSCYGRSHLLLQSLTGHHAAPCFYVRSVIKSSGATFLELIRLATIRLVFPRWDVIAILFSVFLLTYVYLEARANYYRGSILVFACVLLCPPPSNLHG